MANSLTPRRVLMTADAVGGVWTYAVDLARGLSGIGVEVILAVLGPSPAPHQAAAARDIRRVTLLETGLPLDWTAEDAADLAEAGETLADLTAETGADLVHLNSPALAADARFPVPVVGVCHSCLATWWGTVRGGRMPKDFRWRAEATRRGYAACDALAAPTAAFAAATATAHRLPLPTVVLNGRRPPTTAPAAKAEPLVFASGRLWDAGKNLAVLDRAAGMIDRPVFAAGPLVGPNGDHIALTNIQVLGPQSQERLAYWYARAAVYCSTALYEPFGLGVLEAAQAGCALVLSDIPSFRELWEGAAVFVDPTDAPALAAVLTQLTAAPVTRTQLGAAARARAARYTATVTTAGMLDIYRGLLGRAAFPPAVTLAEVSA